MKPKSIEEASDLELKADGYESINIIKFHEEKVRAINVELNKRTLKNQELLKDKVATSETTASE